MRHSAGGASWAALAHPAVGLVMSGSLGVGGGALLGAALATSVPRALRPRVPESAVLRWVQSLNLVSVYGWFGALLGAALTTSVPGGAASTGARGSVLMCI